MANVCDNDFVRDLDSESKIIGGNNDLADVNENEEHTDTFLTKNRKGSSGGESDENTENSHEISVLKDAANTSTKSIEKQREGQFQASSYQAISSTISASGVSSLNTSAETCAEDFAPTVSSNVNKIENNCDKSTCNMTPKVVKFCDICSPENLEIVAISFCTTCMEYYCENCHRLHSKCKVTKNHEVIVDKIPDDISVFKWMAKLMSCPQHPDFEVSYICYTHKISVCLTCLVEAHRNCSNIRKLTDDVTREKDKTKDITANIDAHLQLVTSHIAHCRKTIAEILSDRDEILHSIGDQADSLIGVIVSLKTKAEQEVRQVAKTEIKSLNDEIDLCNDIEDEADIERKAVDVLAEEGIGFDADILRYVIWGKVRQHNEALSQLKTKSKHLHFIKNPDAIMTVHFGEVNVSSMDGGALESQLGTSLSEQCKETNLGDGVHEQPVDLDETLVPAIEPKYGSSEDTGASSSSFIPQTAVSNSCLPISVWSELVDGPDDVLKPVVRFARPLSLFRSTESLPESTTLEPLSETTLGSETSKHSIRIKNDSSQCSVSKCIVLKNGTVVLVDSANNKLKIFSHTFRCCFYLTLEGHVDDICHTKDQEVAILYNKLHTLVVYYLDWHNTRRVRSLSMSRHQSVKCIAADKVNERFAMIYHNTFGEQQTPTHIQIRSFSGELLCDFDLQHLIGQEIKAPLNSNNCGIRYTRKGLILVGDGLGIRSVEYGNKKLVFSKLKTLYVDKENEMQGMTNHTCDVQGSFYICSPNSVGVVKYNCLKNYQSTKVVSDILRPMAIEFLSKKMLVVGCTHDDFVHVYNLKKSEDRPINFVKNVNVDDNLSVVA